jgi:hypothetical protein
VWRTFDAFPMETLTKAWVFDRGPRQRSVDEMEAHRAATGASGNCFDLALWLRHRLTAAGLEAHVISDDIASRDAHVAVLAVADDRPFLCDLGDLWLQPLAADDDITEPVAGLFPAAGVTTASSGHRLLVTYHRPGGKTSSQTYDLRPVQGGQLRDACEQNQQYLAQRLVEMRDLARGAHWEFDGAVSRWSTEEGLHDEPVLVDNKAWALRIAARTGMNADYAAVCLDAFDRHGR